MFAWRKRRQEEEDQPLVPHGLIWQATDEADDPARGQAAQGQPAQDQKIKADAEASVTPTIPAQPILPILETKTDDRLSDVRLSDVRPSDDRLSADPPPISNPTPARENQPALDHRKLGAISPPIPWPSPQTSTVIKRTPAEHAPTVREAPAVPPTQNQAKPADVARPSREAFAPKKTSAAAPTQKFEIIEFESEDETSRYQKSRHELTRVFGIFSAQADTLYRRTTNLLADTRGRAISLWQSPVLKENRGRIQSGLRAQSGRALDVSRSAMAHCRSIWEKSGPKIARVRSLVGSGAAQVFQVSRDRSAGLFERARQRQVRIHVVLSPWTRSLVERARLGWMAAQKSRHRDSRLWTSLAMGALSASLAIGMISLVSRYSPSTRAAGQELTVSPSSIATVSSNSTSDSVAQPAAAGLRRTSARREKPSPSRSKSMHRVRSGDDEYVAPNTYTYYGNSRTRQ